MNELALFAGSGGGLLGTKLLGFSPVGYVEWDEYCQKIIRQRIIDGLLEDAPIFGDIRSFIDQGFAGAYTGLVDILTAGFPCQPFAAGGFQRGAQDDRNRWPETLECIRIVRPRGVLLENSARLVVHEYFGEILGGLAALGYHAEWDVFSACMFGAPQTRERLFLLAYPDSEYEQKWVGSVVNKRKVPKGHCSKVLKNWMGTVSRNAGGGAGMAYRWSGLKPLVTGRYQSWYEMHGNI